MSDYRVRLGKYGENLAAQFLIQRGYQVIEKNYYTQFGEIDLIVQLDDEILFVEVKTRTTDRTGWPETAVDYHKLRHLQKAARIFLNNRNWNCFWHLDIISVELNRSAGIAKIKWFNNISLS
ncbi:MAG: YraN family protein [Patescibacteria group bacterium]|jgi:putative endonuclease